jgi:hypothetical protein
MNKIEWADLPKEKKMQVSEQKYSVICKYVNECKIIYPSRLSIQTHIPFEEIVEVLKLYKYHKSVDIYCYDCEELWTPTAYETRAICQCCQKLLNPQWDTIVSYIPRGVKKFY